MIDHARIMDTSFSRNRLITLENLIYYLIFRNQQVLSQDIVSFFGNVNDFDIPTRQAIIKRMNILNFDVWNHILRQFRQNIYFHLNLYKLKDYIVIAVDGSFLDLPSHPALNHYFGGHQTKKISVDDIKKPQAKVSMIYDVLNRMILDFSVGHYRTSEIPMLFTHLRELMNDFKDKKIIILADRYYGSAELFKYCEMYDMKYIVRSKKNFFKHYISQYPNENDFSIEIQIDNAWMKRMKNDEIREYVQNHPHMKLRVVRGKYQYIEKNGKKEKECTVEGQYFTNLEEKEFDTKEIIDIYHLERWHIETAYDVLKNDLDVEQFNTHNPIGIINQIMGKVIFYNIEKLVYIDAKEKIIQKKENKYVYIPNNKNIINILHSIKFVKEFVFGLTRKTIDKIIEISSREKIPVRKGRHYKRWNKFLRSIPTRRHRIDGRRNPPVVKGKTGFVTTNH